MEFLKWILLLQRVTRPSRGVQQHSAGTTLKEPSTVYLGWFSQSWASNTVSQLTYNYFLLSSMPWLTGFPFKTPTITFGMLELICWPLNPGAKRMNLPLDERKRKELFSAPFFTPQRVSQEYNTAWTNPQVFNLHLQISQLEVWDQNHRTCSCESSSRGTNPQVLRWITKKTVTRFFTEKV